VAARVVPYGSPYSQLGQLKAQETHLQGTISYLERRKHELEDEIRRVDRQKLALERELTRVNTAASSENNLLVQVRAQIRNLELGRTVR